MNKLFFLTFSLFIFLSCKEQQSTWLDPITNYMWQNSNPTEMTWSDAKRYCDNLDLDGYSDWHLPTISELKTLIEGCENSCEVTDECLSSEECWSSEACSCDSDDNSTSGKFYWNSDIWDFNEEKPSFWSSSLSEDNPSSSWYVGFDNGGVDLNPQGWKNYARCVRS